MGGSESRSGFTRWSRWEPCSEQVSLGKKWEQKLTTQDTREWGRGIETSLTKTFALKEKETGEEGDSERRKRGQGFKNKIVWLTHGGSWSTRGLCFYVNALPTRGSKPLDWCLELGAGRNRVAEVTWP